MRLTAGSQQSSALFTGEGVPSRRRQPPHPAEGGAAGPSWLFSVFKTVPLPELCSPVTAVSGRDFPESCVCGEIDMVVWRE